MISLKFRRFLLILTLFCMCFPLSAQSLKPKDFGIKSKKALGFFLEGRQQEKWRSWAKAAEAHEMAIELEPDFADAHFRAGLAYVMKLKYDEALPHLEKANSLKPGAYGGIGFYLGQAYFFNEQYEKAIGQYEAYLQEGRGGPTYEKTVKLNLKKARFAKDAIKDPVAFVPVNLGTNVNSDAHDYLPCLTADEQTLLIVSRRSGSGYNEMHREYTEDFYFCKKEGDGWSKAQNLGTTINTDFNEGAACLTQDGRTLFFTGCNRPDGMGSCDLYISHWDGKGWSDPQNLGPSLNSEYFDGQPSLSHDGKRLYFVSNRKEGKGGDDIWFSEWDNGVWTTPQNLPGPINTEGNENQPFLHADDQTLYFSSDFHPGFGDADLFVSYREPGGEWGTPKNLGYPINTSSQEANITVNTKGTTAYFNSFREGGLGKSDLYSFEMDKRIRPRRATFLRGLTRDSITHAPVRARIRLVDVETGDTVRTIYSDRGDGTFLMSLPLDREYAATVEAPKYLFTSKNFFLKDLEEEPYFDLLIELKPFKKGATVVLQNIFFESGRYELMSTSDVELRFLIHYMKQNPRMKIEIQGHTDNVGSEDDNRTLSANRAGSVRDYLIEKGISADRITSQGYGEDHPVADNETEEGRAQNRRTEFKVLEF